VKNQRKYLGVDVGGTKILASVVEESGKIVARERSATPRGVGPEQILATIETLIEKVLEQAGFHAAALTGIGIAVPGVVEPETGRVIVTPNMPLTGVALGAHLEARYDLPVALGNDCNLGVLGEAWLGSARSASSSVGIFVGTGIGSGIVRKGKLWRGARESAGEIGHIVMQIGGPRCGCGNRGCLEALASRTAIERDLRQAVAAGRQTVLTQWLGDNLSVIRSSELHRALDEHDPLVTEVMHHAAEVLGYACLTVRHLIDPQVIVLGGGVIKACSEFVLPIVENIVGSDQLSGAREGGGVLLSALGDDAVVLGAVAVARKRAKRNPFKKRHDVKPSYPLVAALPEGQLSVDGKIFDRDVLLLADGRVDKRGKARKKHPADVHAVAVEDLERLCQGGPEEIFIGTGPCKLLQLGADGQRYLTQRAIRWQTLPTETAIDAYNRSKLRKAALLHVKCSSGEGR
jgi:glucokinase